MGAPNSHEKSLYHYVRFGFYVCTLAFVQAHLDKKLG